MFVPPTEPVPPVVMGTMLPPPAVEYPPKPVWVITPILDDIHKVNDDVRADLWHDPPPEQVWDWWRSAWCRRP
ncbi:MAG: hypothetical protein ACYSU7_06275 [Planctomycetota bacterium]|jgi:hypothetical protein